MGRPLHARDGIGRRGFLVTGGSAVALLAVAPSCTFDLGSRQEHVVIGLYAHEVDGFLHFETSPPSGELFAGDGPSGFLQWNTTQNYSTAQWDDGFCRLPSFP